MVLACSGPFCPEQFNNTASQANAERVVCDTKTPCAYSALYACMVVWCTIFVSCHVARGAWTGCSIGPMANYDIYIYAQLRFWSTCANQFWTEEPYQQLPVFLSMQLRLNSFACAIWIGCGDYPLICKPLWKWVMVRGSNPRFYHCFQDEDAMLWTKRVLDRIN